jgi:hypothetical protein
MEREPVVPTGPLETLVPILSQRPEDPTSALAAVLSFLSRPKPYASGPVVGAITLFATADVKLALLACLLGPPAIAGGRVLAKWIELLEPPSRWRGPGRWV